MCSTDWRFAASSWAISASDVAGSSCSTIWLGCTWSPSCTITSLTRPSTSDTSFTSLSYINVPDASTDGASARNDTGSDSTSFAPSLRYSFSPTGIPMSSAMPIAGSHFRFIRESIRSRQQHYQCPDTVDQYDGPEREQRTEQPRTAAPVAHGQNT